MMRYERELRYAKPSRRSEIIRILTGYPAVSVKDLILNALEDDSKAVRFEAARAASLGQLPEALPYLFEWLKDSQTDIRIQAAIALGNYSDERIGSILIKLLDDTHPDVQCAAIEALERLDHHQKDGVLVDVLLRHLSNSTLRVRLALIKALGRLGQRSAAESLIKAAQDGSDEVRQAAYIALGELRDTRAVDILIQGVEEGKEEHRHAAIAALGRIGTEAAIDTLSDVLQDSPLRTKKIAILSLGQIHSNHVIPNVIKLLDSPELGSIAKDVLIGRARRGHILQNQEPSQIFSETCSRIDRINNREGYENTAAVLEQVVEFVSIDSIVSSLLEKLRQLPESAIPYFYPILGITGSNDALHYMIQGLQNPRVEHMDHLLMGLNRYFERAPADRRAFSFLVGLLNNADTKQHRRIIGLLGMTGTSLELSQLYKLLENTDSIYKQAIIKAIGNIGGPNSVRTLVTLLDHHERRLRFSAAQALAKTATVDTIPILISKLESQKPSDRYSIILALEGILDRLGQGGNLPPDIARSVLKTLNSMVSGHNPNHSALAIDALAAWGHPDSARIVAKMSIHPSIEQRVNAISALAEVPTTDVRHILRHLLRKCRVQIGVAATVSLGEMGTSRDAMYLIKMAERASWPLPSAIAYALARLSRRGVIWKRFIQQKLCLMGKQRDPYVRSNLAAAMAAMNAPPCPDNGPNPLNWLSRNNASVVRAAAARWANAAAISGHLPLDHVRKALIECSSDPSDPIVAEACRAPAQPPLQDHLDITAFSTSGHRVLKNRLLAVRLSDGTVYIGYSDINGRLRIHHAPRGAPTVEDPGLTQLEHL